MSLYSVTRVFVVKLKIEITHDCLKTVWAVCCMRSCVLMSVIFEKKLSFIHFSSILRCEPPHWNTCITVLALRTN